MRRKYFTLDVFTRTALAGNPLAVVMDCYGLDTARMQAVAREFNLSETVFVFAPRDPVNTARARIFTPGRELPFAGHPTVGTAALLAHLRAPDMLGREDVGIMIEEAVGVVSCTVGHRPKTGLMARFTLPKLPEDLGAPPAAAELAEAFGLAPGEIGFGAHRPSLFSAGVPFRLVPVAGRSALGRASPRPTSGGGDAPPAFLYCDEPSGADHHFRARMFSPGFGIAEDPATGSAAAALAGAILRFDRPDDGEHMVVIEQGYEMGRPSEIALGLDIAGGTLVSATIGGGVVLVTQGILDL